MSWLLWVVACAQLSFLAWSDGMSNMPIYLIRPDDIVNLPQAARGRIFADVVESVEFLQRTEPPLQIIDDGPRHKSLGAVKPEAGPEMHIMVNGRFFFGAVGEI
jgi:hypothetical protein